MAMRLVQVVVGVGVVALMLWRGIGAGIVVFAVVLVAYAAFALMMPFFVRAGVTMVEKPEVIPLAKDDVTTPGKVPAELSRQHEALVALGFELRDVIHLPPGAVQGAYMALYHHQPTGASALSRVILRPRRPMDVQVTDLEFEVRYENDTTVELSNVVGSAPGLEQLPGLIRRMSQVTDPATLWNYFQRLVAKHEREARLAERSRVPVSAQVKLGDLYHSQLERSFAIQRAMGLLEESGKPGVWRPTWRMALLIAATHVSPGAEFLRRRVRVRGERLQRELDGDSTLTRAERFGARGGWLMLVTGLVLGAIAVLMAPASALIAASAMAVAWTVSLARGNEPGWRALVTGGVAALLVGVVLFGGPFLLRPDLGLPTPGLSALGAALLPLLLLTASAVMVLEGFRAAAT